MGDLTGLRLSAHSLARAGRRESPGYLMPPYLAWVGFASALNFALWRLNAQLTRAPQRSLKLALER